MTTNPVPENGAPDMCYSYNESTSLINKTKNIKQTSTPKFKDTQKYKIHKTTNDINSTQDHYTWKHMTTKNIKTSHKHCSGKVKHLTKVPRGNNKRHKNHNTKNSSRKQH